MQAGQPGPSTLRLEKRPLVHEFIHRELPLRIENWLDARNQFSATGPVWVVRSVEGPIRSQIELQQPPHWDLGEARRFHLDRIGWKPGRDLRTKHAS